MSPRKLRLVAQTVVRMPAKAAVDYLKLMPKAAAAPLAKLIASAIANASHNAQIAPQDLVIQQVLVNQGPTLKRFRPRAFGRAGMIRKRSSHVSVTLVEHSNAAGRAQAAKAQAAAALQPPKTVTLDELKRGLGKGTAGEPGQSRGREAPRAAGKGFTRKLFQRKSG